VRHVANLTRKSSLPMIAREWISDFIDKLLSIVKLPYRSHTSTQMQHLFNILFGMKVFTRLYFLLSKLELSIVTLGEVLLLRMLMRGGVHGILATVTVQCLWAPQFDNTAIASSN